MEGIPTVKAGGPRRRVLFVQLPLLDNDPAGETEHPRQAALYLKYAIERSGENRYFEPVIAGPELDRLDNRNAIRAILGAKPAAIAATLYVWNVERSLRVLREVRRLLPEVFILVGGPEVARPHPFLFRNAAADVIVSGEGEPVFANILRARRLGRRTDFANVAWRVGRSYRWGQLPPPRVALNVMLPPANDPLNRPNANGTAYLETTRGCLSKCAFCCYRQHRTGMSWISVAEAVERIRVLRRRGAREIRLIDPTFNSHPHFAKLLAALGRLNADRKLEFFAELRADTITPLIADLLAAANVRHVEVGIQSSDRAVLRAVGRANETRRTFAGIELLAERGLSTTLDVMCGLPKQTPDDVRGTVRALARVKGGNVQLLHTLLIPGSRLREHRTHFGLTAQRRPPYRVTSTRTMTEADMANADIFVTNRVGKRLDSPARLFVCSGAYDLFPERVYVDIDSGGTSAAVAGCENRRAVLFRHRNLFAVRDPLLATMRTVLRREPDVLWQFVLCPTWEEPLDLVDRMIEVIDQAPGHFLDRLHVAYPATHRLARRVFILLRRGRRYDPAWKAEAEALLSRSFY